MELLSSLSLTAVLGSFMVVVCVFAAWSRRATLISSVNIFLFLNAMAFGIRPILSASEGGYFHYDIPNPIAWGDYNYVLICQLTFTCSYLAIYMASTRERALAKSTAPSTENRLIVNVSWSALILAFCIGTASLGTIHLLSHGAWLPGDRTESISSVVPFGKVLFPLVDLSLSLVIPMAFCVIQRASFIQRCTLIAIVLVATLEIALMYQRGFLIYSLAVVLFSWWKLRGSLPVRAVVTVISVGLFVLFAMRPLVDKVSPSRFSHGRHSFEGLFPLLKDNILHTDSFDLLDVFVISRSYVQQNGLLLGKSFINDFARILPPALRNDLHIQTITDTLNIYYWGNVYLDSHIGLAIYLPHVLYVNFGFLGMFLGFLPGYATARVDRWLLRLRVLSPRTIAFVYAGLIVNGFMGEEAGDLQWGGATCLIGLAIQRLSRGTVVKRLAAPGSAEGSAWA
jgi:hypothetical protein